MKKYPAYVAIEIVYHLNGETCYEAQKEGDALDRLLELSNKGATIKRLEKWDWEAR